MSVVSLTPAFATTYAPELDRVALIGNAPAPSEAAQAQTWGATYDALTGKFAIATDKAEDLPSNCTASACDAAAALPTPALQTPARSASATPPGRAGLSPSATAVNAAANWYATTLISDAYAYNGANNAFLVDDSSSYLPAMPDFNSWGMMIGGLVAVFFLMRRMTPSALPEPDAVEQAWGGPEARALELRAPTVALKTKAIAAIPKLCCSRQALPGS